MSFGGRYRLGEMGEVEFTSLQKETKAKDIKDDFIG